MYLALLICTHYTPRIHELARSCTCVGARAVPVRQVRAAGRCARACVRVLHFRVKHVHTWVLLLRAPSLVPQ